MKENYVCQNLYRYIYNIIKSLKGLLELHIELHTHTVITNICFYNNIKQF